MSASMYGGPPSTDRTPVSKHLESDQMAASETIKMDTDNENVMVGGISSVHSGQVNI